MQNYFSENVIYYISNLSKILTWKCFITLSTNVIKKKKATSIGSNLKK